MSLSLSAIYEFHRILRSRRARRTNQHAGGVSCHAGQVDNDFQGTLIHIIGDGVMVVFNDPIPCPAPCLLAVQMSIEMRSHVSALMERWQTHGYDIGFGIGVSQGYATLGLIGFENRSQYSAIGTVTNLASRLCGEAADGQIF